MKNFLCGILLCLMVLCAGPAHAVSMTSGTTTSGSVPGPVPCNPNPPGDCYQDQTFSGTTGQGVNGSINDSFGSANFSIYKPPGMILWTTGTGSFNAHPLPATGTYTVRVSSPSSGYGGYNLYYVAGGEAVSNGALTSGTTAHDTMPQGGLTSYTFSGTAGQGMQLYVTAAGAAWRAYIFLYKPDGTFVGQFSDSLVYTLPVTGTYNVVVKSTGTGYGAYDLSYVMGGGAVADGALLSGSATATTLPEGQMRSYTISGVSGSGIMITTGDMAWGSNADIYVFKPDGTPLTSATNNFIYGALPVTGTYTVIVSGSGFTDAGALNLYYVQGADSVSNGALPSGSLDADARPANSLKSYKVAGVSGQYAKMNIGSTTAVNTYVFYPSTGAYWGVAAQGFAASSMPATGDFTAVVNGSAFNTSGPYNAYYVKGHDNVSEGELVSGQLRAGVMPLNGLMSYHFQGTSGNSMNLTFTGTNYAWFVKPDGTTWSTAVSSSPVNATLPATGEYTVALYPTATNGSGAYNITVTTTPPAVPPCTPSKCPPCPLCERLAAMREDVDSIMNGPLSVGPAISPILGAAFGAPLGSPLGNAYSLASAGDTLTAITTAINGALPFIGNGMEFDLGFKQQTVTDYQAGGLSFVRTYRSDSTWTDNTLGMYWRHNYARTLTVVVGTSASITDGTGVTTAYTWSGGAWVPSDPSTRATLQTVTGGWVYTLPNNTVEKYDSTAKLTRVEYFGGGALNLTYNGSNQLTGIANENGRSLSLTYSSGRVATLVTPDGTFGYSYDASGNLTTVTRPNTKTILYDYTNGSYVNALTGVTNELGTHVQSFTYTTGPKMTVSQYAGGVGNYGVAYNVGDTSTGTNPLGKAFTYHYKNLQGVRRIVQVDGAASTNTPASSEYYNYDIWGRMIGKYDWLGNVTRYQYDARSNPTRIFEATYTGLQRFTNITWNATWNVPALVTQPGKTTAFAYDTYGRLTSVTVTDTATAAVRTTTYSYYGNSTDGAGNVILGRLQTIDGPRTDLTDTTTYAYDGSFNLTTITNALSQVTTITARDSAGRPTKVTDPNSVETDFTYDTNGRLQTAVRAFGTALAATTTLTYDDAGDITKITLPNSAYVQYSYDNAQRLTGITDSLGNTETYTLDNDGNPTQVVVKNTVPATTYTHTATFDELSRLLHSIGATSQTGVYAWDKNSNLTSYTDPLTNPTTSTYDALNRIATVTNALSGVTTPGYNPLDQVTSFKDQRNNSTTYTYNAFGDVTGETSPNRGTLSYTVDKAGNVTQSTDARSVVTNYTYDAINRLATVAYPSDTSLNATLTYDASSGCGTPYKGHLCSVTDAAGTTAYQYDSLGRVTQQKDTRGALNFTTSYTYDLAGNILTITLPSGRVVTYTRNANGQVSGVSAVVNGSSTTLASSLTYMPFGPLKGLTYGNSLTFSATYNTDYYLTNRTVSGSIYNWTYTPDANGNITQAGATTYGYDALNRVNAENPGTSASYTYDATSNRLTKVQGGTTTTTVPSTSNKISAVGANSYTYDAAGNITGDGVNTYTWSAAGLLGIVKVGGTTVGTYTYNAWNQRAKKVAASTAYYVYGAGGLLYGEYDTSGNFIREYIYLNGSPLAQINAGTPEVLTYLHTDHLGTPRFGTNAAGSQVWAWANDAFGTSTPTGTATVNLRMPGQYFDSESGLFYNWNRYYNPAIGRYISSDLIGIAGGLNTFGYVAQNPVMQIDPDGNATFVPTAPIQPLVRPLVVQTGEALAELCAAEPGLCAVAAPLIGGAAFSYYVLGGIADRIINCPNASSDDNGGAKPVAANDNISPPISNVVHICTFVPPPQNVGFGYKVCNYICGDGSQPTVQIGPGESCPGFVLQ